MVTSNEIHVLSPELIWRAMDDGLVIVSPEEGKVRVLNESGSLIWSLVDGNRSIGEIAVILSERFEVTADQAHRDVNEFLRSMARKGLILWA